MDGEGRPRSVQSEAWELGAPGTLPSLWAPSCDWRRRREEQARENKSRVGEARRGEARKLHAERER